MAYAGIQQTFTLVAAADLSGAQYALVRASAAGLTNIASLSTNSALVGVLQNKPLSGQAATVADFGLSKVIAGASATVNTYFTNDSSGRAVAAQSGDMIIGRFLEAPGAGGDIVTARLMPPVRMFGAA